VYINHTRLTNATLVRHSCQNSIQANAFSATERSSKVGTQLGKCMLSTTDNDVIISQFFADVRKNWLKMATLKSCLVVKVLIFC